MLMGHPYERARARGRLSSGEPRGQMAAYTKCPMRAIQVDRELPVLYMFWLRANPGKRVPPATQREKGGTPQGAPAARHKV